MKLPGDKRIFRFLFLVLSVISAMGLVLRCQGLDRFLEYDEVWTLWRYIALPWHEIFTHLATPNNHCLNSLFIKWLCALFQADAVLIRLPALTAGLLTILLALRVVWNMTRRSGPVFLTALWIAFQPFLIHYSRTARGYSLQIFFVLAFFLLLIRPPRASAQWKTALALFACAAGACLSVTSGLIFVGAGGAAWLLCFALFRSGKKSLPAFPAVSERGSFRVFAAAGGAFLILAGLWYGSLYGELKQGQQFGAELAGLTDFLRFCLDTLNEMHLIPLLILTAAALCIRKRNPFRFLFAFSLIFCVLTLLSALATKAGPVRVYLPLLPPMVISGAAALPVLCRALRRTRWLLPASLIVSIFPLAFFAEEMDKLESAGSEHIAAEVMAETPENVVIVYRRGDEIPVLFNVPSTASDLRNRLCHPSGLSGLLLMGRTDALEVMDGQGGNADIPLTDEYICKQLPPKQKIPLTFFPLEPLGENGLSLSGPLFMNIRSGRPDDFLFRRGQWLRVGAVITAGARSDSRDLFGLYVCEKPAMTLQECLNTELNSGGRIRFYRFRKTSQAGGAEP